MFSEHGQLDATAPVLRAENPFDVVVRRLPEDGLRVALAVGEDGICHNPPQPIGPLATANKAAKRMGNGDKEARIVGGYHVTDKSLAIGSARCDDSRRWRGATSWLLR